MKKLKTNVKNKNLDGEDYSKVSKRKQKKITKANVETEELHLPKEEIQSMGREYYPDEDTLLDDNIPIQGDSEIENLDDDPVEDVNVEKVDRVEKKVETTQLQDYEYDDLDFLDDEDDVLDDYTEEDIEPQKPKAKPKKQTRTKKVEEPISDDLEELEDFPEESIDEIEEEVIQKPTRSTTTTPKKKKQGSDLSKNLNKEDNTFITIPDKYLLRFKPRTRSMMLTIIHLVKNNRRKDKINPKDKDQVSVLPKWASLSEFINWAIVEAITNLMLNNREGLRKEDLLQVEDSIISLLNSIKRTDLKSNAALTMLESLCHQQYPEFHIKDKDFQEPASLGKVEALSIEAQNAWRKEHEWDRGEQDVIELADAIQHTEIPIYQDKIKEKSRQITSLRKEITRIKRENGITD